MDAVRRSLCTPVGIDTAQQLDLPFINQFMSTACLVENYTMTWTADESCLVASINGDLYYEWKILNGSYGTLALCGECIECVEAYL